MKCSSVVEMTRCVLATSNAQVSNLFSSRPTNEWKKNRNHKRLCCVIGWCAYDISTFSRRLFFVHRTREQHFLQSKKRDNATFVRAVLFSASFSWIIVISLVLFFRTRLSSKKENKNMRIHISWTRKTMMHVRRLCSLGNEQRNT